MTHYRLLASTLAAALALAIAAPAAADNAWDAEQRRLAQQAAREGRSPAGILPLLRLWRNADRATPGVTRDALAALVANRRLSADRRAHARGLLARALLRNGDTAGSRRAIDELDFVTDWQVVGPFDNEGKQGFDRAMGPEEALSAGFDADARWRGKEREVGFRLSPATSLFGYTDFDAVFRPYENTCGYAVTTVHSERAQALSLYTGAGGAIKVFWNGVEVLSDGAYRLPDPDRQVAMVAAQQGANRLMVKVCVAEATWGFFLRVADGRGGAARGVRIDAENIAAVPEASAHVRLPRAPALPLATLEAAAAGDDASADALEDLAMLLSMTGADDPAENRARQLAARAADRGPTIDRLRLAAALADQRGDVMRFVQRAEELAENDPRVRLLAARVQSSGFSPEHTLPLLDRLPEQGMEAIEGAVLRAHVLADMDLTEAALAVVSAVTAETGGAPRYLREHAAMAQEAGHADVAVALRARVVGLQHDDRGSRRRLIADHIRRGEAAEAVAHLEALHALAPSSSRNLRYLAGIYEALGRNDDALELFRRALQLAPEDATSMVAMGQLLLRLDQPEAAIQSLRGALALRPQDAVTRELLEQIHPAERPDERFAADSETLLARRVESARYPLTTLADLTVNTVYENGLGSSFRQLAVQIHDDEGARRWRSYSMQFDPASQRLDVRIARVYRGGRLLEATRTYEQAMGEPWYRIYYDTRALVVVFPDLEPGDVVELQWRIDDVSHRNLFADYYGDLSFLQDFTPSRRIDYVLITPESREFYFNEPRLQGLEHERTVDNGTRVDHFHASDVPALHSEPGMPGMTEVAPYLHVSTYRTWQDVGHWYWGLIEDQLNIDAALQATVDELVADAPDLETKVKRIHNWVIRNTRYVGLEFGIHGFKPYPVTQIARRGFGDCKDKASLMFAMFRAAGIPAHIVLVRTRRNGAINDLPASLSVFDHAIAYVPGVDLYLDGTAEHSGTTELPQGDQGVTVLHVWPEGSELRRSPVLDAERNRRTRTMAVELAADGSADIDVQEEVVGAQAPGYRNTYASEGTRSERFERSLRGLFPGLRLESQEFGDLEDLETSIRYRYRAHVPQLAQADGDTLRLSSTVLDDLVRSFARTPSRTLPLDLGGTSSYVEERTVSLPRGSRASQTPAGGEATSPYGRLRLTVETSATEVQTRTEFELRRDRIPADEYPAFRRWVEEADQLLRQRVIVEGGAR